MDKKSIIISVLIIITLLILVVFVKERKEEQKEKEELLGIKYNIQGNETKLKKYNTENPVVAMYIKNYGSIVIELYPNKAPNTVNNFIDLIKNKFYDNNYFHRLEKNFVLQGGDKKGDGTGSLDYSIKGEFQDNNFNNDLKHEKGIVSMARNQEYDSASSQFFICLSKNENLDGQYAAFGKVIDGWDNIERIEKNEEVIENSNGKLKENLVLVKTIVDLKDTKYSPPKKIKK